MTTPSRVNLYTADQGPTSNFSDSPLKQPPAEGTQHRVRQHVIHVHHHVIRVVGPHRAEGYNDGAALAGHAHEIGRVLPKQRVLLVAPLDHLY